MAFVTNVYNEVQDLRILAPTAQVIGINFDPDTGIVSFTRGNGRKVLVMLSKRPIVHHPFDQTTYKVGDYYKGSRIVYRGSENEIDISEFITEPGTWYIIVYEFNGLASVEKYLRNPAIDNPITVPVDEDAGIFDETFDDSFE